MDRTNDCQGRRCHAAILAQFTVSIAQWHKTKSKTSDIGWYKKYYSCRQAKRCLVTLIWECVVVNCKSFSHEDLVWKLDINVTHALAKYVIWGLVMVYLLRLWIEITHGRLLNVGQGMVAVLTERGKSVVWLFLGFLVEKFFWTTWSSTLSLTHKFLLGVQPQPGAPVVSLSRKMPTQHSTG